MGDMSKCSHGEYVGYCDTCSPDWELQLITAEAQDKIYQRGFEKGAADFKRRAVEVVNHWEVPVGNSAAGEMACEWTMQALRNVRDSIESLPLIQGEKE